MKQLPRKLRAKQIKQFLPQVLLRLRLNKRLPLRLQKKLQSPKRAWTKLKRKLRNR